MKNISAIIPTQNTFRSHSNKFLDALKTLKFHDHACLLYTYPNEKFSTSVPFIRFGLQSNERCLCIVNEEMRDSLLIGLQSLGVDTDAAVSKGSLRFVLDRKSFFRNGFFDSDAMIIFAREALENAKKNGFSGMRIFGEMSWIIGAELSIARLIEYEEKINTFFLENESLGLYQYDLGLFSSEFIIGVIHTHPFIIIDNIVCKNFYYVPANYYFDVHGDTKEVASVLLRNLVDHMREEQDLLEMKNR